MSEKITQIEIKGFRSLADVELNLPNLAVLIGANGSGKSNLMNFFRMLNYAMTGGSELASFVARYGGANDQLFLGAKTTPRLEALISIETEKGQNDYKFALVHVAPDNLVVAKESYRYSAFDYPNESPADWKELPGGKQELSLKERDDTTAKIITGLLRKIHIFQFHDTSEKSRIKALWDVTDIALLRSHGGNLAPILHALRDRYPSRYHLLIRQISRILPTFVDFELEPAQGKIQLRWRHAEGEDDWSVPAHLTSDGSLRCFCLMTLLHLPPEMVPDVVLIDEPELGLHPVAIEIVGELIKSMARERQVIISTQSPLLVDVFDLENILVADLEKGGTRIQSLKGEDYQSWLKEDFSAGTLWQKNVLGGQP